MSSSKCLDISLVFTKLAANICNTELLYFKYFTVYDGFLLHVGNSMHRSVSDVSIKQTLCAHEKSSMRKFIKYHDLNERMFWFKMRQKHTCFGFLVLFLLK